MVNFYRRFIPRAVEIQAPLTKLLGGPKGNEQQIEWNPSTQKAFEGSKTALANATLLAYPSHKAPLSLMVDASDVAIGSVLQQWSNNAWQPLAFYTQKLSATQKKYSAYNRELFATCKTFQTFFRRPSLYHIHRPQAAGLQFSTET